jgi:transposase, IS30 family
MRYSHFKAVERKELSALLKKGYSLRFVASTLGKSVSSVSREIKRNSNRAGVYEPDKAQYKAYVKRLTSKHRGMKIRSHPWLEDYVKERLGKDYYWTPEQIAERLKFENEGETVVTHKSIYQWLYSPYGQAYCQFLPRRRHRPRKRSGKTGAKELIKGRIFIDERPEQINQRTEFGHCEGDTLGAPKTSKQRIAGIQERISRKLFAVKVRRLKYSMDGFKKLLNPYQKIFLSWTLDNGVENVRYKETNLPTYFCHPYHSWEKGSLENSFGRFRRFVPKKMRMEQVTQRDIQRYLKLMNNTPRKVLDWRTPNEVFKEQIRKLKQNH